MRIRILLVGLVLATLLLGCEKPSPERPPAPPAPVTVVVAAKKTVPVQIRTIGSVKPLASVAVRPRVGGELMEVLFKEGEDVKKGQKLFVIDPRPFEAAVKLAEANRGKSQAVLKGAETDLTRLQKGGGGISASEIDAARTALASAQAVVGIDEAAVASARLQLSFTTINSILDGRVGELLLDRGNLVDANAATALVVVNQISPIEATFALPEPLLPAVGAARGNAPLKVEAYLRDSKTPILGVLSFVDNAVNSGSGTILLKAEFPNADRKLWPGQFVDVVLTIRERTDSVVVPAAAVQAGQKGSFVFVVTPDRKAELRPVTVEFEVGNEAVIATGLSGGETVVIQGQLRLVAGAAVSVKPAAEAGK